MSDDKIHYLNAGKGKAPDKEILNYFFEGAAQYAEYQDAEKFAAACMFGVMRALDKLKMLKDDNVHQDVAVISVLLVGMYMRQANVPSPETHLLTDIRDSIRELNNRGPANDSN
jgi:hypothetical protein